MAFTSAARLAAPSGVLALRSSMRAAISASFLASGTPSASKNSTNSRLDLLARCTICSATGARSAE